MPFCPQCKKLTLASTAKFCEFCGASLTFQPSATPQTASKTEQFLQKKQAEESRLQRTNDAGETITVNTANPQAAGAPSSNASTQAADNGNVPASSPSDKGEHEAGIFARLKNAISNPEARRARSVEAKLKATDDTLFACTQMMDGLAGQVAQQHSVLKAESANAALGQIDIEELSAYHDGLRLGALKSAGIVSVDQVLSRTIGGLSSINGISTAGAQTMRDAALKLRADVVKTASFKLDPDNRTPKQDALILALHAYRQALSLHQQATKLYAESHEHVAALLADLALLTKKRGPIPASANDKQKAIQATALGQQLLDGPYDEDAEAILAAFGKINLTTANAAWADYIQNAADYIATLESICGSAEGQGTYGLPEEISQQVEAIALDLTGLNATLRSYQEFGVQYVLSQGNVLLGDEMGLGKTMQAIASMVCVRNAGGSRFMVVCPASVLANWCREIAKFCDIPAFKAHGKSLEASVESWISSGGVLVTTFEAVKKISIPSDTCCDMLIVDEAHYIKNPEAARTKAVLNASAHARRRLFMTGTPMENKVEEMEFLISCLQPDVAAAIKSMASSFRAPEFRDAISCVYFRRRREDVLTELPDLVDKEDWCPMNETESAKYRQDVTERKFMDMRQVSWNINADDSSKMTRLAEICEEAQADNRKVIVFSFFLNTLLTVQSKLQDQCFGPITGSIPPEHRQEVIDDFSMEDGPAVLLAQIQAGGTGLNIQAASVIVLCEPQLKPSIENQAIARAYRMGQTRSVLVHRLLCEESVDERIMEILKAKQTEFDQFADESVAGSQSLEVSEEASMRIMEAEAQRLG